jgi:hypothetical protein
METAKIKFHVPKSSIEDEAFWKKHAEAHAASGISKSAYCHINKVDYPRFIYWSKKKVLANASGALVAVKLKPTINSLSSHTALCTLTLKSGGCLSVYDERVLPLILERLS